MLISEFITELEKLKTEHGDVQVLMRDEYGNEDDFDCFPSSTYNPFSGEYDDIVILEM
jgi:hypothetical protein